MIDALRHDPGRLRWPLRACARNLPMERFHVDSVSQPADQFLLEIRAFQYGIDAFQPLVAAGGWKLGGK
jgi:hypothetical protein